MQFYTLLYFSTDLKTKKMNELQNLVELLDASKTEHILPNDNTAEYNEGYVKGMNVAMNRIKELSLFSVSKRFWHFDCWDRTGKLQTITIEALNEENATIIFKAKHEDLGFDPPY